MSGPRNHYVGLIKPGEGIVMATPSPTGLTIVPDPENPPPGMCLRGAVEAAAHKRRPRVVLQRQSSGGYFPVALVERKAVTLLFDPGASTLMLTPKALRKLKRLGVEPSP